MTAHNYKTASKREVFELVEEVVSKFEFRGLLKLMQFEIRVGVGLNGMQFECMARAPNVKTQHQPELIPIRMEREVPFMSIGLAQYPEEAIIYEVKRLVFDVLEHEGYEGLWYDGEHRWKPHGDDV